MVESFGLHCGLEGQDFELGQGSQARSPCSSWSTRMRRFVIGCDSGKERMWHLDFLLEKVRETNGHDKSSLKQGEKERKRMDAWSQKAEREM